MDDPVNLVNVKSDPSSTVVVAESATATNITFAHLQDANAGAATEVTYNLPSTPCSDSSSGQYIRRCSTR